MKETAAMHWLLLSGLSENINELQEKAGTLPPTRLNLLILCHSNLHITHNASCFGGPPPPPILHNLCFLFLLGIAVLPKKNGRQCFCKWLGGKQNVLWEMCKCWSEKNSRDWVTGRAMVEVPVFTFFLWNLASYWMKTNGTALSFDANFSSFSFAKSPSRDLQITANKKLSAHAQCHWTVFGSK